MSEAGLANTGGGTGDTGIGWAGAVGAGLDLARVPGAGVGAAGGSGAAENRRHKPAIIPGIGFADNVTPGSGRGNGSSAKVEGWKPRDQSMRSTNVGAGAEVCGRAAGAGDAGDGWPADSGTGMPSGIVPTVGLAFSGISVCPVMASLNPLSAVSNSPISVSISVRGCSAGADVLSATSRNCSAAVSKSGSTPAPAADT